MPLTEIFFPAEDETPPLPFRVLLSAVVCGSLFVLAPFPQLLVCKCGVSALLATSFISPVCGIVLMTAFLIRAGGAAALQIRLPDKRDIRCSLTGTFVIVAAYAAVNGLWKLFLRSCGIPFAEEQALMLLAKSLRGTDFLLFALLVTIPIPIAEELLFRRILYALLRPAGQKFAVISCAAFFSAVHLYLAGAPGLFVIGAGFQLLFLGRRNLAVSILSHALLNAFAVLSAAAASS